MNIHNYTIDKNLLLVEPLYDTWGSKKGAGYWGLDGDLEWHDSSKQKINNWFAESLKKTIDSFSSLVRISHILWRNGENNRGSIGFRSGLEAHSSYEEYLEKIFQCLKNHPILIEEIEIEVDMFVYIRTETSPDKPIRAWVRNLGDMSINVDREDEGAYLWLNMEHTLFYPFSYQNNEDNTELFELNQPFIEEGLRKWEQKFNSNIDIEGLPGIYKYGFLPTDQWRKKI